MKKILFLASFFLFSSVHAEEFSPNWEECFINAATLIPASTNTIQVKIHNSSDTVFTQTGKILPKKIFEYPQETDVDFEITKISGIQEDSTTAKKNIQDGNRSTMVNFDPYNSAKKEILIDAKKQLNAGRFTFALHYEGELHPQYFVSKDAKTFLLVKNVEDFNVRYIKILFEGNANDNTKKTGKIRDIRIFSSTKTTLLITPKSPDIVHAWSGFLCKDTESFRKALQKAKNEKVNYSLSKETQKVDINWEKNAKYNDDFDEDAVANRDDNCPFTANTHQEDTDKDQRGDVCDFDNEKKNFYDRDTDNDGLGNSVDNCPYVYNPQQKDSNADGQGDKCADDDRDGILGYRDNCPYISNRDQKDVNQNDIGDACEFDKDKDGIFDSVDNCMTQPNPEQNDEDKDGIGDVCDNCEEYNPTQKDADNSGVGDVCEQKKEYEEKNDDDKDGVLNAKDNCRENPNPKQKDSDKDGVGDACDNCTSIQNRDQKDTNKNNVGDFCEDVDNDSHDGYLDNCPYHANADQADADNNGTGDMCEDKDYDRVVMAEDNCPFTSNRDQKDTDGDGVGDKCDDKDDRFLESNKWFVVVFIVLLTGLFGVLIANLVRKLKS